MKIPQHKDRIGRTVSVEAADRACLKKRRFPSRNAARDFAARGKKKFGNTPQEPYRCTLCAGWHLATVKEEFKKAA